MRSLASAASVAVFLFSCESKRSKVDKSKRDRTSQCGSLSLSRLTWLEMSEQSFKTHARIHSSQTHLFTQLLRLSPLRDDSKSTSSAACASEWKWRRRKRTRKQERRRNRFLSSFSPMFSLSLFSLLGFSTPPRTRAESFQTATELPRPRSSPGTAAPAPSSSSTEATATATGSPAARSAEAAAPRRRSSRRAARRRRGRPAAGRRSSSGLVGAEADHRGRREERRGLQPGREGERQRRDAPDGGRRGEEGVRGGSFFLRCRCCRAELFEPFVFVVAVDDSAAFLA